MLSPCGKWGLYQTTDSAFEGKDSIFLFPSLWATSRVVKETVSTIHNAMIDGGQPGFHEWKSKRSEWPSTKVKVWKPSYMCRSNYKQDQGARYYNSPAIQTAVNKEVRLKTRRAMPIEGVRPRWDDRVDSDRMLTALQAIFNIENFWRLRFDE